MHTPRERRPLLEFVHTAAALLLLASVQTAQIIGLTAESRPAEAEAVSLELGTASAFGRVRQGYVGITLSFLYDDPGWENTSILTIDLDDSRFGLLMSQLAPGILRVGGGGEFKIVMDVNSTCAARGTPAIVCLTMSRWGKILAFAKRTGVQLVWGLGAQRRDNGTAPLDFSNIAAFLDYTAALGPTILYNGTDAGGGLLGFELGNELDGGDYTTGAAVLPEVLAEDYRTLRALINSKWAKPGSVRPLLVGPAMHNQATWAREFLRALGPAQLDLFSFHVYVG
jgi:hypothetical protein